jgi:hypothetical protein
LDVLVEDFTADILQLDDFGRVQDTTMQGASFRRVRNYTFTLSPETAEDSDRLEGWLTGKGHYWSFSRTRAWGLSATTTSFSSTSDDAGAGWSGGTSGSSPVVGSHCLRLASNGTSVATVGFGTERDWSLSFYQIVSPGTRYFAVIQSVGGVVEAYLDGSSVATVRSLGTVSAASGVASFTLLGRLPVAGTNAQADFDEVRIRPFSLTAEMRTALGTPSAGVAPPFVLVSGDLLRQSATISVPFKAFVRSEDVAGQGLDGGFAYDGRRLNVELVER